MDKTAKTDGLNFTKEQQQGGVKKSRKSPKLRSFAFGRHQTFHLRTGWLKKGYKAVKKNPLIFSEDEATSELGVGKNMVESIKYWSVAMGILEARRDKSDKKTHHSATKFARRLFQADPYLEDPASNWLLHYKLVTAQEEAPLWYFAFNHLSLKEFNRSSCLNAINLHLRKRPEIRIPSEKTLTSDFLTFIRTYCERVDGLENIREDVLDSPFAGLGLITHLPDRINFRFRIGPKNYLPSQVVAYAILQMLERRNAKVEDKRSVRITLDQLLWDPESPGMCFKLDGETLVGYVEDICSRSQLGKAEYSTSAGMKQLFIPNIESLSFESILTNYQEVAT